MLVTQHVLKDKGVLALIKKKAAEQEGKEPDQQWDMKEIVTFVSDTSNSLACANLNITLKLSIHIGTVTF